MAVAFVLLSYAVACAAVIQPRAQQSQVSAEQVAQAPSLPNPGCRKPFFSAGWLDSKAHRAASKVDGDVDARGVLVHSIFNFHAAF
jgi:hypothetical protein